MSIVKQFGLLLWKNWLIVKRKKILTAIEIVLPALFALIFLLIKLRITVTDYPDGRSWGAFSPDSFFTSIFNLAHFPSNNLTDKIVERAKWRMFMPSEPKITFDSEREMEDFFATNPLRVLGGVVFDNIDDDIPNRIKYRIRFMSEHRINTDQNSWYTQRKFPFFSTPGPRSASNVYGGTPDYWNEGFLAVQRALDKSLTEMILGGDNTTSSPVDQVDMQLMRTPYPPYSDDPFVLAIQNQFPFLILISFTIIAPNIAKDIILEKERRLKEFMKMMGMSSWLHWTTWFIKYFLFTAVSSFLMTLFYCVPTPSGAVLNHSDPTVILVFFLLYSIASISFCFACSVFFKKSSQGAAATGIIFFLSYVPYFFLQQRYEDLSAASKWGASIMPNVAMAFGSLEISRFEGAAVGVNWNNLFTPVSADDTFAMGYIFIMLIVDSVIGFLVTWYFDNVLPGDFGIPKKLYFPFTRNYWCGSRTKVHDEEAHSDVSFGDPEYFEKEENSNVKAGIKIRNLRKEFNKGKEKKVAVAGTTMNMHEGQITALLGHNGAGKTTTMSILTGFLPPTSGTAYINGVDIREDLEKVRKSIGLCPQHDVLFDNLTVHEHLAFFAEMKGCPGDEVEKQVSEMLSLLHLEDKTNELSTSLSGGMKRKLSVGIALIHGSKTVILDEPTSGMDPEARRQMWDILQSQREGRTMILSTHFMDEADLLGDRIAIMAEGEMQCCGSSMFLKQKYGVGYHMVMVKQPGCDVNRVTETVKKYVPDAVLESNISAELSFILPEENKSGFEDLFSVLEENKTSMGIDSFGASVTTMEEVFLKVGEKAHKNVDDQLRSRSQNKPEMNGTNGAVQNGSDPTGQDNQAFDGDSNYMELTPNGAENGSAIRQTASTKRDSSDRPYVGRTRTLSMEEKWQLKPVFGVEMEKNTGLALSNQQFMAMVIKRAITSWRSRVVTIVQLLVPLVFTAIAGIVIQTLPGRQVAPNLVLTMAEYDNQVAVFNVNSTRSSNCGSGPDEATLQQFARSYASVMEESVSEVYNYTGSNISVYYSEVGQNSLEAYNSRYLIGASIMADTSSSNFSSLCYPIGIRALFNNRGYHTVAITLNAASNAILRFLTGGNHTIEASNHPFPPTNETQLDTDLFTSFTLAFVLATNNLFGMAFLMSTFVVYVIRERAVKSKHIQYVSGVSIANYWMSTFVWDFINYCFPVILIIILYVILQFEAYVSDNNLGILFFLMVMYGCAALPMTYLLSYLFDIPSSGYVWSLVINLITGIAAVLAVFILKIPSLGTLEIGEALEWVFYVLFPNFGYGNGLQDIYVNFEYRKLCLAQYSIGNLNLTRDQYCALFDQAGESSPCCPSNCEIDGFCTNYQDNPLAWDSPGIGRSLTFLGIQTIVFFALIWLSESSTMQRFRNALSASTNYNPDNEPVEEVGALRRQLSNIDEDDDVAKERDRIKNTPLPQLQLTDSLIMHELRKFYGNFLAVDRLSVGIPQGECFGLLGVNGAGKTTTFKMLTGDHSISSGDAYLDGFSVMSDVKEVQTRLGYCPQFDALIEQMTVKETLTMYARLRGVKESLIPEIVQKCIQALLLQDHRDKQAGQLSGGNKRKLSTGIALIGDPPVIFLDEPTTGMDPVARRMLWDTLEAVRASGRTLILTSHSMEECEALCTRLAIMVNGQFKCLGSTQHLKNKFGEGYTLLAKVKGINDSEVETNVRSVMTFIENTFTGTVLKDIHQGYVHYQISSADISWSKIFGIMEQAKEDYHLEDYSVSQTSLEQVFISFARAQRPPREESPSCTTQCANCCRFFCCSCCRSNNKTKTVDGVQITEL